MASDKVLPKVVLVVSLFLILFLFSSFGIEITGKVTSCLSDKDCPKEHYCVMEKIDFDEVTVCKKIEPSIEIRETLTPTETEITTETTTEETLPTLEMSGVETTEGEETTEIETVVEEEPEEESGPVVTLEVVEEDEENYVILIEEEVEILPEVIMPKIVVRKQIIPDSIKVEGEIVTVSLVGEGLNFKVPIKNNKMEIDDVLTMVEPDVMTIGLVTDSKIIGTLELKFVDNQGVKIPKLGLGFFV